MSTPSNPLKTVLWAAAFAVFMPGPVFAFDHNLTANTEATKAYLKANPCRKQIFKDIPWGVLLYEPPGPFPTPTATPTAPPTATPTAPPGATPTATPTPLGPFQGLWELAFQVEVMGVDDLSGTFIEAKPDTRLTMGLEDADYIQLNNYVDDTLRLSCGGSLLGALVITSFEGTLGHSSFDGTGTRVKDRIRIKFRSKFTWVDLDGKMRTGHLDFHARFDGLHHPPIIEPPKPPWTFPDF
jgi:hypothetical protein